jgi:hypothetical protein
MTQLFKEWVPRISNRCGRMVEVETVQKIVETRYDPGYASVYCFDSQAAQAVTIAESSRGLDQYPVYSDRLTIDVDDTDLDRAKARAEQLSAQLRNRDIGHEVWLSGGKGYHIVMHHDMMCSKDLPWSQRKYVEDELKVDCDVSLYRSGSLISLPGRVHPSTRQRKRQVWKCAGGNVSIVLQQKPELKFDFANLGLSDIGQALVNLQLLAQCPPKEGNRHQRIWGSARDLCKSGVSKETAIELLLKVNDSWVTKKPEGDVIRAVEQAYSR